MPTSDSERNEDDNISELLRRVDPTKLYERWKGAYLAGRTISAAELFAHFGLTCPPALETDIQRNLRKVQESIEATLSQLLETWNAGSLDGLNGLLTRPDPTRLFGRWQEQYMRGRPLEPSDLCNEFGLEGSPLHEPPLWNALRALNENIEVLIRDLLPFSTDKEEFGIADFLQRVDPQELFERWREEYKRGRLLSASDLCAEFGLTCPPDLLTGLEQKLHSLRNEVIEHLLDTWEESFKDGEGTDIPIDELCKDYPDLRKTLATHIADRKKNRAVVREALVGESIGHPPLRSGYRPVAGSDWQLQSRLAPAGHGRSGYGIVWKAYNKNLDKYSVFKFARHEALSKASLENELRLLRRIKNELNHDGIVPLLGEFMTHDPPCLQYAFVDGEDLASVVAREGPFKPLEAASVMLQLSRIVGFAHLLNDPIIHRDLKPSNILIEFKSAASKLTRPAPGQPVRGALVVAKTEEGPTLLHPDHASPPFDRIPLLQRARLWITDFGIGAVAFKSGPTSGTTHRVSELLHGAFTPAYSSPEQTSGESPDPADDVFSIGVIWHELLTGKMGRGAPIGLTAAGERLSGVPESHKRLIDWCLQERKGRIPDARVLASQITKLLENEISLDLRELGDELSERFLTGWPWIDPEEFTEEARERQRKKMRDLRQRLLETPSSRRPAIPIPPADWEPELTYPEPLSQEFHSRMVDHWWLWKEFADAGNREAQCLYGACGEHPYIRCRNRDDTLPSLGRAAQQRCGLAAYLHAVCLWRAGAAGKGNESLQEDVVGQLAVAADEGRKEALMGLGQLYLTGRVKLYGMTGPLEREPSRTSPFSDLRVGRNRSRAEKLFRRGADGGDPQFLFELGKVQGPPEKRIEYFEKAFNGKGGHGRAALAIALYYADDDFFGDWCGFPCPLPEPFCSPLISSIATVKDNEKAVDWFGKAARQGEPAAVVVMGLVFHHAGDEQNALALLRKVGHTPAWLIHEDLAWELVPDDCGSAIDRVRIEGYASLILAELLFQQSGLDERGRIEASRAFRMALNDWHVESWLREHLYLKCLESGLIDHQWDAPGWFKLGEMIDMIDTDGTVRSRIKAAAMQDAGLAFAFGEYYLALGEYKSDHSAWVQGQLRAEQKQAVKNALSAGPAEATERLRLIALGREGYRDANAGEWFWRAKELGHSRARELFKEDRSKEEIIANLRWKTF